jgi:K+-sensing histidine kinase KdpD
MSRFNPLLWPKPPVIWCYGIAVLSVIAALTISRCSALHLRDAPVSLFLCAVMLSAWFGGVGPALLATAYYALAFYYYFLPPIPRLAVFMVSTVLVGSLSAAQRSATESLRRACDSIDAMKVVDGVRELAVKSQRTEKEEVPVTVSDTGVGFPAQQADQVYRRFLQRNLTAPAWGFASAAPSLNRMGGACGLPTSLRAAQIFVSPYLPKSRQRNEPQWLILN